MMRDATHANNHRSDPTISRNSRVTLVRQNDLLRVRSKSRTPSLGSRMGVCKFLLPRGTLGGLYFILVFHGICKIHTSRWRGMAALLCRGMFETCPLFLEHSLSGTDFGRFREGRGVGKSTTP